MSPGPPALYRAGAFRSIARDVVEGDEGDALQLVIAGAEEKEVTHTWRDLSGFAGQTVTLRFGFRKQTEGQRVYVDEVSLGESRVGVRLIYLPLVLRSG